MLRQIEAANRKVNKRLATYVSGIGILSVMIILIVDASLRTIFAKPLLWVLDISEIILAWIVFAAFAYALITGAHVRMTILVSRLPSRLRSGCDIFANLMGIGLFALLTYLAVPYFWKSFLIQEIPMAAVETPVWLGKLAMPVGSILMLVAFLIRLMRSLHPTREVIEEAVRGEEERGF